MQKLFIFGLGYVSGHLAAALKTEFKIIGTSREAKPNTIIWDGESANSEIENELESADAVLISIPPNDGGDLAYKYFNQVIKNSNIKWVGYLSTTGVYGDHQGGMVSEDTPLNAQNMRAKRRILAENQWLGCVSDNCAVNIFRLPGIYGAGRSVFDALAANRAKRIDMRLNNGDKHFFCRAHVADIVQVIKASLKKGLSGTNIYNIVDDLPAPNADIVEFAANMLSVDIPPLLSEAQANMSEMAKSFYAECKHMQNDKIKNTLGITLKYKDYNQGLAAIWQQK